MADPHFCLHEEKIRAMEIDLAVTKSDISNVKKEISDINCNIKSIDVKFDNLNAKIDEKFNRIFWFVIATLVSALGQLLFIILEK